MPTRPNPYYTGADTYGSRNLTPAGGNLGGGAMALPLAQLAASIADAVTYKPENDPRLAEMRKTNQEIGNTRDRNVALGQERSMFDDPTIPLGDIASHAIGYGHMKPEEAGQLALLANAARGPKDGQSMDSALSDAGLYELAAGKPGGSTFNASTYGNRMKPINIMKDGAPTVVASQDSYGQTPVLSDADQKGVMLGDLAASLTDPEKKQVVGANPPQRTPYNYTGPNGQGSTIDPGSVAGPGVTIYGGNVNASTPGDLTKSVETGLQNRSVEEQRFGQMLDYAEGIGAKSGDSDFGLVGNAKRFAQDSLQQGKGVQQFLGAKPEEIDHRYSEAMQAAQAHGVDPKQFTFDPNLDKLGKIGTVLIFNAASIYANQNGRSVSDKDVALMKKFVGDPTQLMSSKAQYLNGLSTMRDLLGMSKQTTDGRLGAPQPGGTPAPAAAPAAPQYQEGQTATGPGGAKLVFRGGSWVSP